MRSGIVAGAGVSDGVGAGVGEGVGAGTGPAARRVRTAAIVQARMGSTRLPGKVMLDLCGRPVLWHVVGRLRRAKAIDRIVVATTDLPEDDIIYNSALEWGVDCSRGSSTDVLGRYFGAAEEFPCDAVVRVKSDCPLIDPGLCDDIIRFFWRGGYRYVTNAGGDPTNRTYPRGLDCEVFCRGLLAEAHRNASCAHEREHVTPYMYWKNSSVYFYKNAEDHSWLRWTLDTPEDYELISLLFNHLNKNGAGGGTASAGVGSPTGPEVGPFASAAPFTWRDALAACDAHPEWAAINAHVEQKAVKA